MDSGRARSTLEYIPVPVHSNIPRPLARVVLALLSSRPRELASISVVAVLFVSFRGRAQRTTLFTASSASAEAGVEAAEVAGAFPSGAEAAEAVAASSSDGGGGDDGGVRSRRHPCVLRRTRHRQMRLRRRLR